MDADFPKENFGLNAINVEVIGGLIYVCLNSPAPDDIETVSDLLSPYLAPYQVAKTKIACQKDIIEACNWKLVIENNRGVPALRYQSPGTAGTTIQLRVLARGSIRIMLRLPNSASRIHWWKKNENGKDWSSL